MTMLDSPLRIFISHNDLLLSIPHIPVSYNRSFLAESKEYIVKLSSAQFEDVKNSGWFNGLKPRYTVGPSKFNSEDLVSQ